MRKLLLGMTCWGSHIETFFNYCLPSLNAEGNLPALRKHFDVGFIFHTDQDGANRFKDMDAVIFCDVIGGDKYEMIGRHQNHDLALARMREADYHLLLPDFIYSENCFTGVLKAIERGHKAIARLVLSTVQEDIIGELDRPRSAIDLATIGLQHIHPGIKNWLSLKDGYFPKTHVLAWHSNSGKLIMCSPHMTPVYIANEVIRAIPAVWPIDSILDEVIEGDIYLPKPEDEIVIIEISPRDARKPEDMRLTLDQFKKVFEWDTRNSAKQLKLFLQETVDNVNISGDWNNIEISAQKDIIRHALNIR